MRFADLLEKHNDEVAAIETWNSGKTYEQTAKVEIPMVVRVFRYYAGEVITLCVCVRVCARLVIRVRLSK